MNKKDKMTGNLYNLTRDGQRILRGWYLFVSEDGQEYVFKNNWTFLPRKACQCFQVQASLSSLSYTDKMYEEAIRKNGSLSFGIFIAIIFGSFIRDLIPFTFFLGDSNLPVNPLIASRNILLLLLLVFVFLVSISYYRKRRLLSLLNQKNAELKSIGLIKMTGKLAYTPHGKRASFLGVFPFYLTSFILLALVIVPAIFVEYRLMSLIVLLAVWGLCFLGQTINPEDRIKTFEILT
ncbi:hypothetical protein [Streptococcus loxodontisalivarius]|uniref:DUF443 family protein n=1 Tax=Streptococcus loxodontisalivarius TaxID=1349415 RepID=A0ABS2PRU3_9STRE|nr:hypothetical protein [Streptococcus loxodontisalivarius]MBM7642764.1 hypothetical protein [Streptococcus loxodontisalivarius]